MRDYYDDDRYSGGGYKTAEERLWRAVLSGDAADVEQVLTDFKPSLTALHKDETLLHYAVRQNDLTIAKKLLAAGADVNAPSGFMEYTPFILACEMNNRLAIDLLVEHQADVNARTKDQETALHRAAWKGNNKLIKRLVDELDCDINAQNYLGQTAMFCAVSGNFPATIQTLMELGGDPGIAGSNGITSKTPRAFAESIEQRQDVAAVLDDPLVHEARLNRVHRPVTSQPITVGKPLALKIKPRGGPPF